MKKILSLFLFSCLFTMMFSQVKTHTVQAQETIYGISKQYKLTQEELKEANPFLKQRGLQIGDVLEIPEKADGAIKVNVSTVEEPDVFIPQEDANFIYVQIPPQQTIYSLTKEHSISEETLKSLNPQLAQGLKAGDVIRIPKKQKTEEEEEITPEGMYKVQKSDTVFSLSKQFGVSQEEFYIANPLVQVDGLKVGIYVNIPKRGKSAQAVFQDGFIEHTVKQGETIYTLTRLYKVSFAELLANNPELSEGLKAGMVLKIPLPKDAIVPIVGKIKRINDNEINIALILPFHLNKKESSAEKNISTDILIGSKVALDSLTQKGYDIKLTVIDSENETSTIESLVSRYDFSKFDAVVGPLFASNFKALATILKGSGIPLVSPLSNSDDLKELENVLLVTPPDRAIADAIIQEVSSHYKGQEIQILTDVRHQELAEYVSSQLKTRVKANSLVTKNVNDLNQKSQKVKESLSDGTLVENEYFTPLITILVSDNNALGNDYVNKIGSMDAENLQAYGVKFVSAYDSTEKNKENAQILKNIGFSFATVRLVDVYGEKERNTIQNFLDTYCEVPNEYQQVGFDIMYDLVDRMNAKGDFLHNLNQENIRLSTRFKYEKEADAYVNKAVRIVHLFVSQDESPDVGVETLVD